MKNFIVKNFIVIYSTRVYLDNGSIITGQDYKVYNIKNSDIKKYFGKNTGTTFEDVDWFEYFYELENIPELIEDFGEIISIFEVTREY